MHSSRMRTTRSSSRRGGLHQAPEQNPLGPGTLWEQTPLLTEFLTHTYENITLPQTLFAGGNNNAFQ